MVNASDFDLGTGGAKAPPATLKELQDKVTEALAMEAAIETMEADVAAAKQTLHLLRTVRIPDLMTELQLPEFTHGDHKVKTSDIVSGSLPKDAEKRKAAVEYLEKNGAAGLIMTAVGLVFSREQRDIALNLGKKLEKAGYTFNLESTVNHQTLAAWAREKIKNGEKIDTDVLGLFVGKVAKIDLTPEAKKARKKAAEAG